MNEKESKQYLINTNWNLEGAIEFFFSQEIQEFHPQASSTSNELIESLFSRYKSSTSEDIEREGIQDFCSDLGIDPLDPVILVIAYNFKAEVMGIFKKSEFVEGLKRLGCDSISKLQAKLQELRKCLSDSSQFRLIYNYIFIFTRESGCRNLNLEIAIAMWRLLLLDKFPFIEKWIEFLENRGKRYDISKDTWEMLLDFLEIMQRDGISGYDANSAWPTLIDEFVEVLNQQKTN